MQARRALLHKWPPKTSCEEPLKQALQLAAQPCAMKSHTTHNSHWTGTSERLPRLARGFQSPGKHKTSWLYKPRCKEPFNACYSQSRQNRRHEGLPKRVLRRATPCALRRAARTYPNVSKLIKTYQNLLKLIETY